jgi:5'-nucleotidase
MAGEPLDLENNSDDTDIRAIKQNFISITPIQLDLTDYRSIDVIREQLSAITIEC